MLSNVLMFALVVCALYYLMGRCSVEGFPEDIYPEDIFCETKFTSCLCNGTGIPKDKDRCLNEVKNVMIPWSGSTDAGGMVSNIKYCKDINWIKDHTIDNAVSKTTGSWFGTAPTCDGECPFGWSLCEKSTTGDGHTCWSGNKVRCANLYGQIAKPPPAQQR